MLSIRLAAIIAKLQYETERITQVLYFITEKYVQTWAFNL